MLAMFFDRRCFLLAASSLLAGAAAAWADDDDRRGRDDEDDDHDRAMEALRRGHVRPLADIMAEVGPELGGHVVGVEFGDEDGIYVYEFRVVTDAGRLREVYVDATSGQILSFEDD